MKNKKHVFLGCLLLAISLRASAAYDCNPQAAACTYQQSDPRMASVVEWTNPHYQCSGTILARQTGATDSTLILTAAHCVMDSDVVGGYLQVTINYLAAGSCQTEGNLQQASSVALGTWSGQAQVLVLDHTGANQHDPTKLGKDVLLLKISNPPPANTYFSGWNATDVTSQSMINLSHPSSLQTALAQGPITRDQYGNSSISFASGSDAPGSSGSSFFDANSNVAGIIQGGACNATTPPTGTGTQLVDFYSEIKAYLDPNNTGITSVSGYPAPVPPPTESISISPQSPNVGDNITVTWTTTDATTCTASGDWSGSKGTSGNATFQVTQNRFYTYNLSCTNASGTTQNSASVYAMSSGGNGGGTGGNPVGGSSSGGGAFGLATLIPMMLVALGRKRQK